MLKLGKNFKETLELYNNGKVPKNVFEIILGFVAQSNDLLIREYTLSKLSEEAINMEYEDLLGGDFFLITALKDLNNIKTSHVNSLTGQWHSILEKADSFDMCDYLKEEPKVVMLFNACNNSGGPTYFIPDELCIKNVNDSINLTKDFWSFNANNSKESVQS